jgi:large conductance mechanosensitive channel
VISFLLLALGVFLMVKGIKSLQRKAEKEKEEKPAEQTEKVCPFCKKSIPIEAVRCPYCTSELE